MGIQIGAKPDSGFEDPIGMLTDCHRRIEHFLSILCLVVQRAQGRSLSDEERTAVQAALQYFRLGGERHTADEEESLFPRLRNALAKDALEEIGGLEEDHQAASALHLEVENLYLRWISNGVQTEDELRQLLSKTEQLQRLYAEHIRTEEEIVFPRAIDTLSKEAVTAIGQEFQARRK